MDLNSDYIISTVNKIEFDRKCLGNTQLKEKYKEFEEKYPKIYQSVLENVFSVDKFTELIKIHNKAYSNTKGDHSDKQFKSDIEIGEKLARDYLYPTTGTPSKENKDEALMKAKKKQSNIRSE